MSGFTAKNCRNVNADQPQNTVTISTILNIRNIDRPHKYKGKSYDSSTILFTKLVNNFPEMRKITGIHIQQLDAALRQIHWLENNEKDLDLMIRYFAYIYTQKYNQVRKIHNKFSVTTKTLKRRLYYLNDIHYKYFFECLLKFYVEQESLRTETINGTLHTELPANQDLFVPFTNTCSQINDTNTNTDFTIMVNKNDNLLNGLTSSFTNTSSQATDTNTNFDFTIVDKDNRLNGYSNFSVFNLEDSKTVHTTTNTNDDFTIVNGIDKLFDCPQSLFRNECSQATDTNKDDDFGIDNTDDELFGYSELSGSWNDSTFTKAYSPLNDINTNNDYTINNEEDKLFDWPTSPFTHAYGQGTDTNDDFNWDLPITNR